jgi:acyl-CoA reductase-like NAD-dependent aldehyde dehydrogenase
LLARSEILNAKAASAAAEDAPITLTEAGEIFKRFSAYINDRRITAGKGLTAGTFATTKEDADANVKTGADAVSRYALPNSKPASNVFTISPAKDTDLKRGVAQPANNQPGGGVEVIFANGAPDGTVTGPVTIPDK